jgi:hypothetical protein
MLKINSGTFSGNSGSQGGAICNYGPSGSATLEIADTILNVGAGGGGTIYNSSTTVKSDGYNLSSDAAGGDSTTGPGGLLNSTNDIRNTDPLLGSLQDNGGPTWTHALLSGSPAIDQGKRNVIPNLASNTDQRGLPRPVDFATVTNAPGGDGSDIGAYEVQTLPPPLLFISLSGGTVTVYWQNVPGWNLEQNSDLAIPAGWTVNSSWTTSAGTNYLILNSPPGNLFFRLTQP